MAKKAAQEFRWTVMVFMAAESIPDFAPLDSVALDDLAEMAAVPSSESLDILVQLHQDNGARRIHVGRGETPVPVAERDHAKSHALLSFVKWALSRSAPGENRKTMLVLWGHAYQFAVGQTPTPDGGIDALDFAELSDALRRLQAEYEQDRQSLQKFDIVAFDACDLATVEVAVELQPFANYLLASEIGIPLPGWPYNEVLARVADPRGGVMGPAEFGSWVVRRYCEAYRAERGVSLTLLDLARAREIAARVEILARRLADTIGGSGADKATILELFRRSQTDTDKPFVDVADLCLNLMRESGNPLVMKAANALGDLLITPAPARPGESQIGGGRPFVQEHGRNAAKTAKLNGISLYAPHVAAKLDFEPSRIPYGRFVFAQASLWNALVHNLAASV